MNFFFTESIILPPPLFFTSFSPKPSANSLFAAGSALVFTALFAAGSALVFTALLLVIGADVVWSPLFDGLLPVDVGISGSLLLFCGTAGS